MKNLNYNFLVTLIAGVFAFLFFYDKYHREEIVSSSSTTIEVITDDSIYTDTTQQEVEKPDSIVYIDNWHIVPGTNDTFWKNVDTSAIIKDYLAEHYGRHELKDDTMAYIAFEYMVAQNRIKSIFNVEFQNRQPLSIITNTTNITQEKPHLYLGAKLRGKINTTDFGLFVIHSRKRWIYKGGYFFNSQTAEAGIGLKIF